MRSSSVPITLFFFHRRYPEEFVDSLIRTVGLHLLGIVVFVLDADITGLFVVVIFILEVVSIRVRNYATSGDWVLLLLGIRVLHEIIVVVRHRVASTRWVSLRV